MHATNANCPRGPALLAKAGVSLADAQWFYRHRPTGLMEGDSLRLESIRRKVSSFLAQ
jgi:hypothetical protein